MSSSILIQNRDHPIDVPARITVCRSFGSRLRGLMFRSNLGRDEGLLLELPRDSRLDASIHMFFVPFALAVIWINTTMEVVDKVLAQPWRPAYFPARPARYVVELHSARFSQFEIGHAVEFVDA